MEGVDCAIGSDRRSRKRKRPRGTRWFGRPQDPWYGRPQDPWYAAYGTRWYAAYRTRWYAAYRSRAGRITPTGFPPPFTIVVARSAGG